MGDGGFVPPIERVDTSDVDPLGTFEADARFVLNIDADERSLIIRLLDELESLLTSEPTPETAPLLHRLFPPAFHDDEEKEAEYQRLMRDDLVTSRVTSLQNVRDLLTRATPALSENETIAFMQSVNAVRLVLGTMLGITDDEAAEDADEGESPEHGLYGYLGWLLEWTVQALSGA